MTIMHQRLPSAGAAREELRKKGQFWTPAWVAQAMTAYVLQNGSDHVFDPAVGEGAFFRAANQLAREQGRQVALLGTELDADALTQARENGLDANDLRQVQIRDFVFDPPPRKFDAIVANPPYIRHHRLAPEAKAILREQGKCLLGKPLDGRAGFHVHFLLQALQLLNPGGRLAFIMPADTCEGKFAPSLWAWITAHFRLDGVITFAPDASPFPGVDTNAIVFLICREEPQEAFCWTRVYAPWTDALKTWVHDGLPCADTPALHSQTRTVREGMAVGLSRPPRSVPNDGHVLGDYVSIMRGIATGANDFFFLTRAEAEHRQIPPELLRLAIGRTRDVNADTVTGETLRQLDAKGRPTHLFAPDARPLESFPAAVQAYLREGEQAGLPIKALISQRKPWYRMETRRTPPFLFAYLGRRDARFIRNEAGVVPLTGFLCVYPKSSSPEMEERIWRLLQRPETVAALAQVGKSYGSGAIKVEPRALEQLPLSSTLLEAVGLQPPRLFAQDVGRLFEEAELGYAVGNASA